MTDRYAVIGNPLAHSKSPAIHAAFARQTAQDLSYGLLRSEIADFEANVERFRREGGRGLNVTVPFKHRAYGIVSSRSARAEQAQAVNTMTFERDAAGGDNTDGAGLVRDLTANLGVRIEGRRVLLMGAGGASYGVCAPLLEQAPAALVVANRTLEKAAALCERCRAYGGGAVELRSSTYAALAGDAFDVVVNATSASLDDSMPTLPADLFARGALAYDMVYGRTTPFLRFALAQGARTSDGLGMLVEQAAESFYVWRRVRPRTAPVIALLRSMPHEA